MYRHILIPIDLQEEDERPRTLALHKAIELCRVYKAQLHVLTVVPDVGMPIVGYYFPTETEDAIVKESEKFLHELVNQHIPEDIDVQHLVAQGTVYKRILKMADKVNADLIIMPAQQMKLQDFFIGSNASRVVRYAKCSVLVVRADFDDQFVCIGTPGKS
ncbi:MAG: universal stress protein [Desulfonatronovibrionaceae bacterium]